MKFKLWTLLTIYGYTNCVPSRGKVECLQKCICNSKLSESPLEDYIWSNEWKVLITQISQENNHLILTYILRPEKPFVDLGYIVLYLDILLFELKFDRKLSDILSRQISDKIWEKTLSLFMFRHRTIYQNRNFFF